MKNCKKIYLLILHISLITQYIYCCEQSQTGWKAYLPKCVIDAFFFQGHPENVEKILPKIIEGTDPMPPSSVITLRIFETLPLFPFLVAAPTIPYALYKGDTVPSAVTIPCSLAVCAFAYIMYTGKKEFNDWRSNKQSAIEFYTKQLPDDQYPTITSKIQRLQEMQSIINRQRNDMRIYIANNAINTLLQNYTNDPVGKEIKNITEEINKIPLDRKNIVQNLCSDKVRQLRGISENEIKAINDITKYFHVTQKRTKEPLFNDMVNSSME